MDTQKGNHLKIVLTGGHAATQAMAVSEELRSSYPDAKLFWIGSKYIMPGSRVTTPEYNIFPEIGVIFYPLIVGKLQTKFTRHTIPLTLNIPLSFIQALWYVLKLRPKVILSFGGFSSFPVIFWSWLIRIPIVLHEQTVAAGRSSLISAFFAAKVCLSREESLKYFPKDKSVITGNPIMKEVLGIPPKVGLGREKTILIIGGSRGSEFLNEEIYKILPDLLKKYKVIHVTGERDYPIYKDLKFNGYKTYAYVDPRQKRSELYKDCDLIISRAGASTVSEVLYIKRPSIFIPLPRTFMDEQYKNAIYAEKFGIGKVLSENEVSGGLLLKTINEMFVNWQTIVDAVIEKPSPDVNASQKITKLIGQYL